MTRGVLIFAIPTNDIDYAAMAQWSAKRIQRHLGLPTTIIDTTDQPPGQRWFGDIGSVVTWHNTNRMDAWRLSPYDETLVLDADYIVNSKDLLTLFDSGQDFLCMGQSYDITGLQDDSINVFGRDAMRMAWATVMFFRRCQHSQLVFEYMSMIRDNWAHYRDVYGFERTSYRNDYALAIALNTLNGHWAQWPVIPWRMANVNPEHQLRQTEPDAFEITWTTPQQRCQRVLVRDHDLHAMCKQQLMEIVHAAG